MLTEMRQAPAGLLWLCIARRLRSSFHETTSADLWSFSSQAAALGTQSSWWDSWCWLFWEPIWYAQGDLRSNSDWLPRVRGDSSYQGGRKDEWLMKVLLPVSSFVRSGCDKRPTEDRCSHSLKNSLRSPFFHPSASFPASAQMPVRIHHHGWLWDCERSSQVTQVCCRS